MSIEDLLKRIETLERALLERDREISELKAKIVELERRLNQNSSNSSKLPSMDGFNRPQPKSLREKSGKPRGGQRGRLGKTLVQVENPDRVIVHHVVECSDCHTSLENVVASFIDKRQVFEIPEPKMDVIEHQGENKLCPSCGLWNRAGHPDDVNHPVQYGPRTTKILLPSNQR